MTSALLTHRGLRAVTREVDPSLDLLDALGDDGFAWLHDGTGLVTAGTVATVAVTDAPAALATIDRVDEVGVPGTGPIAVGALPFDPDDAAMVSIPAVVAGRSDDGRTWITEIAPQRHGRATLVDRPSRYTVSAVDDYDAWCRAVQHAVEAIARGELEKVVLSRAVTVDSDRPFDRRAVLRRLLDRQPGCFVYAAGGLVGATPELLIRRAGARVESRPLAGTAVANVAALAGSTKDASEHRFVVDAIAERLAPVCDELAVPDAPRVVQLTDVAHLATSIVGRLRAPLLAASELATLLHPTPAVAGSPTAAALAMIRNLEQTPRGRYAGPIGWVDANGDGEWGVALRGAEIDENRALLRSGAGIVAASDPDSEWDETEAKLDPMLRALVRA